MGSPEYTCEPLPAERLSQQLAQLQASDAHKHDPVRWRYITALIERAQTQRESVQTQLLEKAENVLEDYQQRYGLDDQSDSHRDVQQAPNFIQELKALVEYLSSTTNPAQQDSASGLGALNALLLEQDQALNIQQLASTTPTSTGSATTLKSSLAYQQLQEKQRIDQFIDKALQQTPENPGPLNPEVMVIKMIKQLYQLSPEYVGRYISYFETLRWLEKERQ